MILIFFKRNDFQKSRKLFESRSGNYSHGLRHVFGIVSHALFGRKIRKTNGVDSFNGRNGNISGTLLSNK